MKKGVIKKRIGIVVILMIGISMLVSPVTVNAHNNDENTIKVDITGQNEGYSAFLYDNTNGLPTAEANVITETPDGFIWIGGYGGLIRYDGNQFLRMDSTHGITSVVSLFADSSSRLWVGTNDSGAAVIENGETRVFDRDDGLKSLSVRSIVEDNDGLIYLATTEGLAVIDQKMHLKLIDDKRISEEYIREIKFGRDGVVYGITMNGAVFSVEKGKIKDFYDAETYGLSGIHCILPDSEHPGYVYLGTQQSDIYYARVASLFKVIDVISTEPFSYINSMVETDGIIWLCSDNGIGYIQDNSIKTIENIPDLSAVECMMVDYQGNLWFTSSKQGVMKIVPNRFMDIFTKFGLEESVVNSTCIYDELLFIGDKNNGLTIASDEKVLEEYPLKKAEYSDGTEIPYTDLIEMLKGCRIRSIVTDSKNRLWISTFSDYGLIRYDSGSVMCFSDKQGMPSARIRTVTENGKGQIIVACTGGVAVIEGDEIKRIYNSDDGIENTEILTVAMMDHDKIAVGTDGGGIYIIDGNKVTNISTETGLSSDVIMRIKKDRTRDLYWLVTSNSIGYMNPDYTVETIHNFPYSNNFDLYQNSGDDMWILSSNGIYVIPTEEMLKNDAINPEFFNNANGLPYIATANSYSALTEDSELYISGSKGVAAVNIDIPFNDTSALKVGVPYIEADGKYIYPDESGTFIVPADVVKITVHPHVFTYSLTNPTVKYILNGFDVGQAMSESKELSAIDYTNLPGGEYNFNVQIADSKGRDGEELTIHIIKLKKIYEEPWFIVCAVLAGIIFVSQSVYMIIRKRLREMKKKEQEQKTLIDEITKAFAKTIDMKDKYTNGHSSRVADYTVKLARELGYDEDTVEKYYHIALLHDIGKIGIRGEVLNKPGKLTDEEFKIIKSHSTLGYNVLKDISIMPELAIGAGSHHERPDGKGYPRGLKEGEIPRVAQIIAVADTFDAMYSDRPYRKRMNFDKVVSIMKEVSGTQLTADVVDAFLRLVEKGEFKDPNDDGGGSTEDINNIRTNFEKQTEKKDAQ